MRLELAIAAAACFLLAVGHTAIGVRWVLRDLTEERLPGTPFGPPSMTLTMLRFTWEVVSLMLVAFGVLLATLALAHHVELESFLLRWFAAFWLVAAARAVWDTRRRLRRLLRLPVPLVFLLVAAMCLAASA